LKVKELCASLEIYLEGLGVEELLGAVGIGAGGDNRLVVMVLARCEEELLGVMVSGFRDN